MLKPFTNYFSRFPPTLGIEPGTAARAVNPRTRMAQARFIALWRRCVQQEVPSDPFAVYKRLVVCYSQPHRHYHTIEHITYCLRQLDQVSSLISCPDVVEMGVWFHDAIYDPQAQDNEQKSADLFMELGAGSIALSFCRQVERLILVTRHNKPPRRADEQYIVDIDLSSFGRPWEEFKRDSDAVRKEFSHVPDEEFFARQATFLKCLLDRPIFYSTEFFRKAYEQPARRNITRYLQGLQVRGLA